MGKDISLYGVATTNEGALREYNELMAFPDSIENYKKVVLKLIKCAETENQRENLGLLVDLFKNNFKKNSKLMNHLQEIEIEIYKLRTEINFLHPNL